MDAIRKKKDSFYRVRGIKEGVLEIGTLKVCKITWLMRTV
jgi:hypothetical protein